MIISIECESCSVMSDLLPPHGLHSPWNSPGQNTGVGSHSLRQQIFPTQGSNPGLPHCRQILYQLSYQGSSKTVRQREQIHFHASFCSIQATTRWKSPTHIEEGNLLHLLYKFKHYPETFSQTHPEQCSTKDPGAPCSSQGDT